MNPTSLPAEVVNDPAPTRYYGIALAPSLASSNDTPFVVANVAEAKDLLLAISDGRDRVVVREWVHGAVVESTTSFVGAQSTATELWLYATPPAETDDPYPDYQIRRGPRGGVQVEKLAPPRKKRRREPRVVPTPILASEVVIL